MLARFLDRCLANFFVGLFVFLGLFMLAIIGMEGLSIYASAQCLAAGYPNAQVTYALDIYCVGIDGVVTNRVNEL